MDKRPLKPAKPSGFSLASFVREMEEGALCTRKETTVGQKLAAKARDGSEGKKVLTVKILCKAE